MFRIGNLEKIGVGTFALAVIMVLATIAFARPAMLTSDGEEYRQPSAPVHMKMQCREAIERTEKPSLSTTFVIEMTPNLVVKHGFVSNLEIGRCFADAPSSAYNALGGQVDMHVFTAGGNTCKISDGDVTFTIFYDRSIGTGRYANLTVKDVVFNCQL